MSGGVCYEIGVDCAHSGGCTFAFCQEMKIGHDENYLSIERRDESDPYSGFSISARCGYDDSVFTGSNGAVHFDQTEEAKTSFEDFESLKRNETRIDLTEGCYLVLHRQARGDIQIEFEIRRYRFDAILRGRVIVDGENSTAFLHQLGGMAFGVKA